MKGSVPPTWSGAFTYVSTTSSITWSWSGLTILRADGTTTAIPNNSVAIASLTAGTTYYFYPYWDETAAAIVWVAGGVGTPGYAQSAKTNNAAQQQALQGRVPLSQGASPQPPPPAAPAAARAAAAEAASARAPWC